jgi:hypothetical protein
MVTPLRLAPPPPRPHPDACWRVVIVRLSAAGTERVGGALGRPLRLRGPVVPAVVYTGADGVAAHRLADELRDAGCDVVVVEEPLGGHAFCAIHPPQLCAETCRACRAPVCPGCRLDANGRDLCEACARTAQNRDRIVRVRHLFALFVFCAFLYAVHQWQVREDRLLDPHGPVDVIVYQFVPPGLASAPLVRALNREGSRTTLKAISDWYRGEHTRYTGDTGDYLDLTLRAPWVTTVSPPRLEDPDAAWWDLLHRAWGYTRYFHDLARSFGDDPDAHTARVYVVYGEGQGDLASESRGSRKGRVAISYIPVTGASMAYAQLTVAHELGHILGADDLYDEDTYQARFPEGFVDPWARPPYPQRYAELMAGDIPISPVDEREIESLSDVRIGYRTAASMGWIPGARADAWYTPPAASLDPVLIDVGPADLGESEP